MAGSMMQMSTSTATGFAPSANPQAVPQTQRRLHFFSLSAELRTMVYNEVLINSSPDVIRSLVPPALLQTNRAIRQEAAPMYYGQKQFEITVERAPEHQVLYTHLRMPHIDKFAWYRFLTMWDDFGSMGSNVLQHITRITLIYQLSMDTGFGFGEDAYDKRIGFRFLGDTRVEDQEWDATCEEMEVDESSSDSHCDTDTDSIDSEEYEYRELDDDEIEDLDDELDGLDAEADDDLYMPVSMAYINGPPAADVDGLGVFELVTDGDFTWPSREETYDLLHDKVEAYESDNIWKVYPCQRLAEMMWRCGTDCPLAAQSVDFLCEDYQHWMNGGRPYRLLDEEPYDPDEEE